MMRNTLFLMIFAAIAAAFTQPQIGYAQQPTEYSYGKDPLQRLDFYAARKGAKPPLIVFVHGGGWSKGDKRDNGHQTKITYYTQAGYSFASVNYRLVPAAQVEQQAQDIADSIKWLRNRSAKFGFDPNRIVLMGHSAGAHLSALVGTDGRYLRRSGLPVDAIKGVILLDGAAYDVPMQIGQSRFFFRKNYLMAFGSDRSRQLALSPISHTARPNAQAFLILHVNRGDAARQSAKLTNRLKANGTATQLNRVAGKNMRGHRDINRRLGEPRYGATQIVDRWLQKIL